MYENLPHFLLSYEQMIIKCEEQKFEKSGKSIFDLYCALRSDCDMKNMRPRKKNNLHFKITEIYRAFQWHPDSENWTQLNLTLREDYKYRETDWKLGEDYKYWETDWKLGEDYKYWETDWKLGEDYKYWETDWKLGKDYKYWETDWKLGEGITNTGKLIEN